MNLYYIKSTLEVESYIIASNLENAIKEYNNIYDFEIKEIILIDRNITIGE